MTEFKIKPNPIDYSNTNYYNTTNTLIDGIEKLKSDDDDGYGIFRFKQDDDMLANLTKRIELLIQDRAAAKSELSEKNEQLKENEQKLKKCEEVEKSNRELTEKLKEATNELKESGDMGGEDLMKVNKLEEAEEELKKIQQQLEECEINCTDEKENFEKENKSLLGKIENLEKQIQRKEEEQQQLERIKNDFKTSTEKLQRELEEQKTISSANIKKQREEAEEAARVKEAEEAQKLEAQNNFKEILNVNTEKVLDLIQKNGVGPFEELNNTDRLKELINVKTKDKTNDEIKSEIEKLIKDRINVLNVDDNMYFRKFANIVADIENQPYIDATKKYSEDAFNIDGTYAIFNEKLDEMKEIINSIIKQKIISITEEISIKIIKEAQEKEAETLKEQAEAAERLKEEEARVKEEYNNYLFHTIRPNLELKKGNISKYNNTNFEDNDIESFKIFLLGDKYNNFVELEKSLDYNVEKIDFSGLMKDFNDAQQAEKEVESVISSLNQGHGIIMSSINTNLNLSKDGYIEENINNTMGFKKEEYEKYKDNKRVEQETNRLFNLYQTEVARVKEEKEAALKKEKERQEKEKAHKAAAEEEERKRLAAQEPIKQESIETPLPTEEEIIEILYNKYHDDGEQIKDEFEIGYEKTHEFYSGSNTKMNLMKEYNLVWFKQNNTNNENNKFLMGIKIDDNLKQDTMTPKNTIDTSISKNRITDLQYLSTPFSITRTSFVVYKVITIKLKDGKKIQYIKYINDQEKKYLQELKNNIIKDDEYEAEIESYHMISVIQSDYTFNKKNYTFNKKKYIIEYLTGVDVNRSNNKNKKKRGGSSLSYLEKIVGENKSHDNIMGLRNLTRKNHRGGYRYSDLGMKGLTIVLTDAAPVKKVAKKKSKNKSKKAKGKKGKSGKKMYLGKNTVRRNKGSPKKRKGKK